MSLKKIKFGDKEVDKKRILFVKTSYFIGFCRFR